jgi:hypothetical protein
VRNEAWPAAGHIDSKTNKGELGAYRGFLRFWSDDAMPGDALPGEQQAEVRTSP